MCHGYFFKTVPLELCELYVCVLLVCISVRERDILREKGCVLNRIECPSSPQKLRCWRCVHRLRTRHGRELRSAIVALPRLAHAAMLLSEQMGKWE